MQLEIRFEMYWQGGESTQNTDGRQDHYFSQDIPGFLHFPHFHMSMGDRRLHL